MTCVDLSSFDLPSLRSRLHPFMLRQDRYRREAASIGIAAETRASFGLVAQAAADLDSLADLERLVDALMRAPGETGDRRAPVLQLVRRAEPASAEPPPLRWIDRFRIARGRSASRSKVA